MKAIKLSEEPKRREWPFFNLMDVYFSDQVNDPTLRLFSSTKTLGSDTLDESISMKFEDDPIMSAAISAATGHSLMDISDMMQEAQSDKASEHNYEDIHPEVQINNSNYNNGGERHSSPSHQSHVHKSMGGNGNNASGGNGTRGGTPIGMNAPNDYDDNDDIKPPMAHTPVYMPQHHNIDQVRIILFGDSTAPSQLDESIFTYLFPAFGHSICCRGTISMAICAKVSTTCRRMRKWSM